MFGGSAKFAVYSKKRLSEWQTIWRIEDRQPLFSKTF